MHTDTGPNGKSKEGETATMKKRRRNKNNEEGEKEGLIYKERERESTWGILGVGGGERDHETDAHLTWLSD